MGEERIDTSGGATPGKMIQDLENSKQESPGERSPFWFVVFLVLLNLAITLSLSWYLSIWIDEAYSLNTTAGTLAHTLHQTLRFEHQSPLYFCLLNLWRGLHESIFFARLFSVLCITTVLCLCPGLSKRYLPCFHPGWLTACVALNPFVISCAIDVRVYALALLQSAVLLWTFHDGFLASPTKRISRDLFTVFAVLSLYTHYYTGFLLLTCGITLLVLGRWRALRAYTLRMMVTALLFSPLLPLLSEQFSAHNPDQIIPMTRRDIALFLPNRILGFLAPTDWSDESSRIARVVTAILFLGICVATIRNYRADQNSKWIPVGLIFMVLSGVFAILAVFLNHDVLGKRHTVTLFLPCLMCMLWLFYFSGGMKAVRAGLFISMAVYLIPSLVVGYLPLAKPGDYHRAAEWIQQQEKPGQPILFFTAEAALPFEWYYRSKLNQLVPLPFAEDFIRYDLSELVLKSEKDISDVLSKLPEQGREVWLCTDYVNVKEPFLGVDFQSRILEEYVRTHYQTVLNRPLFHGRVRFLVKKPG